jgi:hypothetical protein
MTAVGGSLPGLQVTVKLQDAVLPDPSVAVQVTAVVPIGKVLPEAGSQTTLARQQLSLALAL